MTGVSITTCYAAIDLSKAGWVVAVHPPGADGSKIHRIPGFDVAGLLNLPRSSRDDFAGRIVCCFETG